MTEAPNELNQDLAPSRLGTSEYWEDFYSKEIANFSSFGDEGEIWFGEGSEESIIEYLEENFDPNQPLNVLDLGTGNGHLLFILHEAGFDQWMFTGIDYALQSVELAQQIALKRGLKDIVLFQHHDFLKDDPPEGWAGKFDLILDKGTFDAISLSAEVGSSGRKIAQEFPRCVARLLKPGGTLLLTSCNWTQDELTQRITSSGMLSNILRA